jgi:hypothetical protein
MWHSVVDPILHPHNEASTEKVPLPGKKSFDEQKAFQSHSCSSQHSETVDSSSASKTPTCQKCKKHETFGSS